MVTNNLNLRIFTNSSNLIKTLTTVVFAEMAQKNSFFRWKGTPTKCYDFRFLNLDEEKCTFYTSFLLNDETYRLGEYVCIRVSNETIIGRLLCVYESSEHDNRHRGVLRLYKFAEDCNIGTCEKFIENEIIEDDIQKEVSLLKIKGKCTVIIGTEHDTLDNINPGTYLLRYKFSNSALVPIVSDEAIKSTNVLNQFKKVLTPRCYITSKFEVFSPTRIPYVKLCNSMRKVQITEHFVTPKKSNVCRNLNESFDSAPNSQDGTPVLNYSLIENTAGDDSDAALKIKLRLSQNQKAFVPLSKLNEDIINRYLEKNKENVADDSQSPVRRSTRVKQRISYAETNSPDRTALINKERKQSTDSEQISLPIASILHDDLTKTPSKRKISDAKEGSPKKITRSIRKTRSSIKDTQTDRTESPVAFIPYVDLTSPKQKVVYDAVNTPVRITRSARKTRNSVKEVLPQIDEVKDTSPRKRKISTPSKYRDYVSSPTVHRKSIMKHSTTNNISTPKKSVYYEHDSDSASIDFESPKKVRAIESVRTPKKPGNIIDASATPKTPRNVNAATPKSVSKDTPSSRAKLIREGSITPSVQNRATPVKVVRTPLNMAKSKLHVSYVPKVLACREKEFDDVYNFIEGKLLDDCGGCMYISGVPGTGKTATVTEVIKKLHSQVKSRIIPNFEYVSINGMRLSEPRQSYVEILRQLTGKSVRWEQAQATLDTKFTKTGNKNKPIVLLVDELDILCTKRQDVVYNLLDWPTKVKAQLIIITIANTMDLPERLLMGRVTSRLGLTRLTFQAYTHKQLQEIVTRRLLGTDAFNPDAVQLVARKVASVSGDARRALDICRRAAEIAELEGDHTLVSMRHVNDALNTMITQPKVQAIKRCSRLQQLILQAIVAEVERTGVEETSFSDVYTMLISIAALDGFQMVTCTVTLRAVSRLGACRLLLTDQKSHDFNQKIILNVSSDDVYYALRKD